MLASTVAMKSASVASDAASALTDLGFTTTEISTGHRLILTAGANPVRFTLSGDLPTSTVGHYMGANENVELAARQDITNLSMIGVGGASVVTVTLWSNAHLRESVNKRHFLNL